MGRDGGTPIAIFTIRTLSSSGAHVLGRRLWVGSTALGFAWMIRMALAVVVVEEAGEQII
jgi:hypothetical protein